MTRIEELFSNLKTVRPRLDEAWGWALELGVLLADAPANEIIATTCPGPGGSIAVMDLLELQRDLIKALQQVAHAHKVLLNRGEIIFCDERQTLN